MFSKARIRLTLIYSLLFLFSFWAFSIGLYIWMEHSFRADYTYDVEHHESFGGELNQRESAIANIAGDVALVRLRNTLLILNGAMLIVVPGLAWIMTRRTLAPVQNIHEQQKQFVSDVAHELRTPLSILSGELEVALRKDRTASDYQQVLTSSKQETDHLSELVEHLLFLARGDQGRQPVDFENVDITDLIGSVIAGLQAESSQKQITLHFQPEEEPSFACGHPALLKRLFFNIIHNAIIYTPPGGDVWISLSTAAKQVQVEVKDNGIGIPPESQDKVFNRFYRVDDSRSQTKGYGLGLAISKSIVDLHRGKITLTSALNEGSVFTVWLPVAHE